MAAPRSSRARVRSALPMLRTHRESMLEPVMRPEWRGQMKAASRRPDADFMYFAGFRRASHRGNRRQNGPCRSEEHTSELQSQMRTSYAVFSLKKKKPQLRNISSQILPAADTLRPKHIT